MEYNVWGWRASNLEESCGGDQQLCWVFDRDDGVWTSFLVSEHLHPLVPPPIPGRFTRSGARSRPWIQEDNMRPSWEQKKFLLAFLSPKKTLIWAWVADSRPLYGEPTINATDLRIWGCTLDTKNSLKTKWWVFTRHIWRSPRDTSQNTRISLACTYELFWSGYCRLEVNCC
jgi:hypothetical protein